MAAVAACVAAAAVLVIDRVTAGGGSALTAQGEPVAATAIPASELESLRSARAEGKVFVLRKTRLRSFYRIETVGGGTCFATGTGPRPQFGVIACQSDFPSEAQAILDQSLISFGSEGSRIDGLMGFAADHVARVAVLDLRGRAFSAPVVRNTYVLTPPALPPVEATEIVAYDAKGAVVTRLPVTMG
jgi:hypothetical protein